MLNLRCVVLNFSRVGVGVGVRVRVRVRVGVGAIECGAKSATFGQTWRTICHIFPIAAAAHDGRRHISVARMPH